MKHEEHQCTLLKRCLEVTHQYLKTTQPRLHLPLHRQEQHDRRWLLQLAGDAASHQLLPFQASPTTEELQKEPSLLPGLDLPTSLTPTKEDSQMLKPHGHHQASLTHSSPRLHVLCTICLTKPFN